MKFNRIILCVVLLMLVLPLISGAEWDNLKEYDEETRTITVTNSFLRMFSLSDVARIKLLTPLNNPVVPGDDRLVAELYFENYGDYEGVFDEMEFFRFNGNGKKIYRDFIYKKKIIEEVIEIPHYVYENCTQKIINGRMSTDPTTCESKVSHYSYKEIIDWQRVDKDSVLLKGNYTIGVFTEVIPGDRVEWIPTFYNVRINEWALWDSTWNNKIIGYWKIDENDGRSVTKDEINNRNGTLIDVTTWDDLGIIDNSTFNDDGGNNRAVNITGGAISFGKDENFTINVWINRTNAGQSVIIGGSNTFKGYSISTGLDGGDNDRVQFYYCNDFSCGTGINVVSTDIVLNTNGHWQMITMVYNGSSKASSFKMYQNGTEISTTTVDDSLSADQRQSVTGFGATIAGVNLSSTNFRGHIDEVGFWNRTLSSTEISDIYDHYIGGDGWSNDSAPVVTLNTPIDFFNTSSNIVTFNCSATDDNEVVNLTLFIDGVKNYTQPGESSTALELNATITIVNGYYNWTCEGEDDVVQRASASNRTLNITHVDLPPTVTLISPVDFFNSSIQNVNLSCRGDDDELIENVTLFINGVRNTTLVSGTMNYSELNTSLYYSEGAYNWSCEATDNATVTHATLSPNRSFIVDLTQPFINITHPLPGALIKYVSGNSLFVNWTVSDSYLSECFYDYNSTNTSVTCGYNNVSVFQQNGLEQFILWANDSSSNLAYNLTNWNYYFVNDYIDHPTTAEGSTVIFKLYLNTSSIPVSRATLRINQTYYTPTSTASETGFYMFETIVSVPDGWGNLTGNQLSYNWNFSIGSLVTAENSTIRNLTVYEVRIDNCSLVNATLLNFTLNDEESDTLINIVNRTSRIQLDLTLTSYTNTSLMFDFNRSWTNVTSVAVCVPQGLFSDSSVSYDMDYIAKYSNDDYAEEFYYVDNFNASNVSVPKFRTLRDLLLTDSTSFVSSYTDESNLLVDNAIITILRKYIGENEFREVESGKTNDDGETILHLVEEDVVYKFNVTIAGIFEYITEESRVYCEVGETCRLLLSKLGDVSSFPDINQLPEGTFTITSNQTTRLVIMQFNLNETALMNLTVFKYSNNQSEMDTIINSSSLVASSGTIDVTVPLSYGNATYYATVYKGGELVDSRWVSLLENPRDYFGDWVVFLVALMVLSLMLMVISSGVLIVLFAMVGLIVASVLQILDIAYILIIYIIVAGLLLIGKLMTRRGPGGE